MFIQVNPGFSIDWKIDCYLALLSLINCLKSLDEARILTLVMTAVAVGLCVLCLLPGTFGAVLGTALLAIRNT